LARFLYGIVAKKELKRTHKPFMAYIKKATMPLKALKGDFYGYQ